jgi:demethylmenaquinone methyltransferase/2-methoxy-6-polyprenyl-1,4-benzoquinol methylase
LRTLLPLLGGLISRDFPAYRYLNQSIEAFPSGGDFLSWMKEAGFRGARQVDIFFGSVALYIGEA